MDSQTTSHLPVLPLVQRQSAYKLIIPKNVERKIREWCKISPSTEWSGSLFYTYEGSFKDNNLVLTVKDFYVSDIGTSTYTEYDVKPEIISFMLDNDLLDCKIGLIHSHNTMATFFSGTDNSTLISEGMDTCHFLSLIINNKGEYTARITRKATNITKGTVSTSYNTFEESVEKTEEEVTSIEECIEAFDLVIDKAIIEEDDLAKEVARRFKEIQQEKSKTATPSFNSNVVSPSYKTPSLFSKSGPTAEEAWRSKPINNANTNSKGPSFNLYKDIHGDWHLPMNLVATLTAQLLYGSVIINTATYTKLNLVEWIKNKMTAAFNSRFTNIVDYKFWMSNYSETIIGKIDETYNINCSQNDLDVVEICAKDIYNYINTLIKSCGSNAYIDIILNTISDYIMIDEDEPADESFNAHSY